MTLQSNILYPLEQKGVIIVKGSIEKHGKYFRVQFYHRGRKGWLTHYDGIPLYSLELANKLRARAQEDVEAEAKGEGIFRWERYTRQSIDTLAYLWDWLEIEKPHLAKATYQGYYYAISKHLEPFFQVHPVPLRKLNYTLLMTLLNSMTGLAGKSRQNVIGTLRACLSFALKDQRITAIPPFPAQKKYNIQKPVVLWLPEERQLKVIDAIPKQHQPIFAWAKWHYRRPNEACALQKADFDGNNFYVRWGFSAGELHPYTKTKKEFETPCDDEFRPYLEFMTKGFSNFFFQNPRALNRERHYTVWVMRRIWKIACRKVGESIDLYQGLKHSSCCQFLNEKGGTLTELAEITGQDLTSLQHYVTTEVARKRELMGRKVVTLEGKANR